MIGIIVDTMSPESIAAFIFALIAAMWAYYQSWQKKQVIQAFTVGTPEAKDPAIVAKLPDRSWKMDEGTIRWLTFDASPENKKVILEQIALHESLRETEYIITFAGGYYQIEYGLLKGSSGNPSGK